jgi:hypothetical protein
LNAHGGKEASLEATQAHCHLTASDGAKTLEQIFVEQGGPPTDQLLSRLHIFVDASGSDLILLSDESPEFRYVIEAGDDKNIPIAESQHLNLADVPFKTDDVTNFFAYVEFFPRR